MVLVDTNVVLDVFEDDPIWADWSQEQLDLVALNAALIINPIIYAESAPTPPCSRFRC